MPKEVIQSIEKHTAQIIESSSPKNLLNYYDLLSECSSNAHENGRPDVACKYRYQRRLIGRHITATMTNAA